jgi:nucleotide-binding universal stress UspA family protein
MNNDNKSPFNSVLVPTDFSSASRNAFQWAVRCVGGDDAVIIVLHVIDESLVDTISSHQFASREEVVGRMRARAEEQIAEYKDLAGKEIAVDTIVVEGLPFLEIVRKAEDFVVDAVVMGKVGVTGHMERLLFGSTAEQVLRGSQRPIIVLPESNRG